MTRHHHEAAWAAGHRTAPVASFLAGQSWQLQQHGFPVATRLHMAQAGLAASGLIVLKSCGMLGLLLFLLLSGLMSGWPLRYRIVDYQGWGHQMLGGMRTSCSGRCCGRTRIHCAGGTTCSSGRALCTGPACGSAAALLAMQASLQAAMAPASTCISSVGQHSM